MRTGDRTCSQKLTIPCLEKSDNFSANVSWRNIVQDIKRTVDINVSTRTNSREVLPQYCDKLKLEIKDIFIWAIEQGALTEIAQRRKNKFLTVMQNVQPFPATLHDVNICITQPSHILQSEEGKTESGRCLEKNTRRREKLRV